MPTAATKLPRMGRRKRSMIDLPPYPRTLHLGSSGGGTSKHHAPLSAVAGAHLVIEEKVEGSHVGICFDEEANLILFHRKTILQAPREHGEFRLLHKQANLYMDVLWDTLQSRYVLYGEWAIWMHSTFYDALPAYFLEDDVFDRERGVFLSTPERRALLSPLPRDVFPSVCVLKEGPIESENELISLLGTTRYRTPECTQLPEELRGTEAEASALCDLAEGLYIKHEEDGLVRGRYKWIRKEFIDAIASSKSHWSSRSPIRNRLR